MANLVRQVGPKAAFELVALGEPIDAQRALALGLVNYVVRKKEILSRALALAEKLAAVSKPAMAHTKSLFYEVLDLSLEESLKRARDVNRKMRGFKKP
jgi:enoyl-CoA hydratase/carnithine racemase